jgi:hypothetical protein
VGPSVAAVVEGNLFVNRIAVCAVSGESHGERSLWYQSWNRRAQHYETDSRRTGAEQRTAQQQVISCARHSAQRRPDDGGEMLGAAMPSCVWLSTTRQLVAAIEISSAPHMRAGGNGAAAVHGANDRLRTIDQL